MRVRNTHKKVVIFGIKFMQYLYLVIDRHTFSEKTFCFKILLIIADKVYKHFQNNGSASGTHILIYPLNTYYSIERLSGRTGDLIIMFGFYFFYYYET
jgi:hypothetical protein